MPQTAVIRKHVQQERREPLDLTLFHVVFIFLTLSFVGLVGEVGVSYMLDGRWESRAGFVVGPFSPIYGLGAVLMSVALNPIRGRSRLLQFLVGGIVGGALEYFAGWFFETRYGIVAWSYADQPFNFHGHTCLFMMAVWGAIGVVWANWAMKPAVSFAERVPASARKPLAMAGLVFIVADSALTLVCLDSWFWRMAGSPISNPVQQFCATFFGDEFMRSRFETMGMWPSLANRG